MAQTHDGLTLIVGGGHTPSSPPTSHDVEGHFAKMLELVPAVADRLGGARREARFAGAKRAELFSQAVRSGLAPGRRCRLPEGPDHGSRNQGRLSRAPSSACSRSSRSLARPDRLMMPWATISGVGMSRRCRCTTSRASSRRWSLHRLRCSNCFAATSRNQKAMDGFAQVNAGTISPAQFFAPDNVAAIMAAAGRSASAINRPDGILRPFLRWSTGTLRFRKRMRRCRRRWHAVRAAGAEEQPGDHPMVQF